MFRKAAAIMLAAVITTNTALLPTGMAYAASPATHFAAHQGSSATAQHAASTGAAVMQRSRFSAQSASTGDDYTTHSLSMQEEKLLNLINIDRAAHGLAPLTPDPELSRLARLKSEDMRDRNYFAHESPTWGKARNMLEHFGYDFRGVGENIAHHATVEKAQAAFMTSDGHRRNILSTALEKVGIGVCYDRNGYIYATQLFVR